MDPSELFSTEFIDELDSLDAYVRSQRRQSLADLLRAWSRYSGLLASNKPIDSDDYLAMLFARDAIQDILERATPTVGRVLQALVTQDDSIVLFCSRRDDGNILASMTTQPQSGWWWTRLPRTFVQSP
jgi:hypothetical protein